MHTLQHEVDRMRQNETTIRVVRNGDMTKKM